MKKASFHTLGCKLNYTETVTLTGPDRATRSSGPEPADVFVLNTGTDRTGRPGVPGVRRVLRIPDTFVIVTGCYAQSTRRDRGDPRRGPCPARRKLSAPPSWGTSRKTSRIFVSVLTMPTHARRFFRGCRDPHQGVLKVQDGCYFTCAFCTILMARGASRSVPAEDVAAARRPGTRGTGGGATGVNGDYAGVPAPARSAPPVDDIGSHDRFRINL